MNSDNCNLCYNYFLYPFSTTCLECGGSPKNRKLITNYDRLISKTPEELAEFMRKGCDDRDCREWNIWADTPFAKDASNEQCRKCWLNWLGREAKE